MANFITVKGRAESARGNLLLLSQAIKVVLVGAGATVTVTSDFLSEVTGGTTKEITGTGYVRGFNGAGRKALANKTITEDDPNSRVEFDADDVTWTGLDAGSIYKILLVKEGTSDTDTIIIAHIDQLNGRDLSANPLVTNGSDFTLQWDPEGILQL